MRLENYADHPWIVPTSDVTCFEMVVRACGLAGFAPRIVAESMDFTVQLALVAAGFGVALVPDLAVDRIPEGVELLDLEMPVERTIYLAARAARFGDPGIRALVKIIEQSAETRLNGHGFAGYRATH